MIKLYDFELSGHAHKVRLMLSLLNLEYEQYEVALGEGEHKTDKFSKLNPFHHVPVLSDEGFVIRDSNAIISYLARKYGPDWYPSDALSTAQIQEWLAISTKEVAEGPGAARLVNVFGAAIDHELAITKSELLLKVIDHHLEGRNWIALPTKSIADIALYSYIAHAPEGGVSLAPYPEIKAWLSRIEALPGFIPMPRTEVGLVA